jgi:predicted nucleic acid-binding protein
VPLSLLDTNVIIDFLKSDAATTMLIQELLDEDTVMCSCSVVLAEVYSGLSSTNVDRVQRYLDSFAFLPSTPVIGRLAGHWRHAYARQGVSISTTDALIGATAFVYDTDLVTRNARHFPMPEIRIRHLPRP